MFPYFFFVIPFALNMILYKLARAEGVAMMDIVAAAFLTAGWLYCIPAGRGLIGTPTRRAVLSTLCVVVFGGTIGFLAFAEGVSRSGAARGGFFLMSTPVWTAVIEAVFGARFEPAVLRRGALIIGGGFLLAAPGVLGGNIEGDLFLLCGVISFAVGNVSAKFAMMDFNYIWIALFRALGAGLLLTVFGADPRDAGRWGLASGFLSTSFLMAIFILIRRHGPAQGSLANIYASCLAALLGIAIFDERLSAIQWAGAAVILATSLRHVASRRTLSG